MREKFNSGLMLITLLVLSGLAWSQAAQQNGTLVVSGQPGQIPVVQINGRSYVGIEALARLTNSSLSFKGNQIALPLPVPAASALPTAPPASQPVSPAFSNAF